MKDSIDDIMTGTALGVGGSTLLGATPHEWLVYLSIVWLIVNIVLTIYDKLVRREE